jgi:glycosyltransferase involved in cell wall biosynthesis
VDAFIFNSRSTQAEVLRLAGTQQPGVIATPSGNFPPNPSNPPNPPNPPNPKSRAAEPTKRRPLKLLFVGNLIPRKGLHVLIESLLTLGTHEETETWRLLVVGNPEADIAYARRVKAAAGSFPAGRIVFEGQVSDRRLEEIYRASEVLAVPSEHEGFGIVYLEAMSFGLVPLASRSGGAAELIDHEKNGFLIEPGDAAALARILGELIENPARLAELRKEALRKAAGFPGWAESLNAARDFLLRQCALPPLPPPSGRPR